MDMLSAILMKEFYVYFYLLILQVYDISWDFSFFYKHQNLASLHSHTLSHTDSYKQ